MQVLTHFALWQFGLAKPWTHHNAEEGDCLEKYAQGKKRVAELGCWQGVNTCRIRKVMDPEGIIYAVDPYPNGRLGFNAAEVIAHREANKIKNGSVSWMKMTDLEAAIKLESENVDKLDLIYSDCLNDYEGAKSTWEAWSTLIAPNGIYVIATSHSRPDFDIESAGSVQFVQTFVLKDPRFEHIETAGTFTVLRKRSDG